MTKVDWIDVTGWGVWKGHAIPVDVARYMADKINSLSPQEPSPAADAVAEDDEQAYDEGYEDGMRDAKEHGVDVARYVAQWLDSKLGKGNWWDAVEEGYTPDDVIQGLYEALRLATPSPTAPALVVDEAMVERCASSLADMICEWFKGPNPHTEGGLERIISARLARLAPIVPAINAAMCAALKDIDANAPATEPRDGWTSSDLNEAFLEGKVRGCWEMAQYARPALEAALQNAGGEHPAPKEPQK